MATGEESNLYPGYRRVREVNKYALSQLVLEAIGDKMSQKEFAEKCGLDPSTISRLITMQYSGTYSEKAIKKIADTTSKYNPESGVTEEKLLNAFGLEKTSADAFADRQEECMPKQQNTAGTRRKRTETQFASSARFIISALVINQYSVELMPSEDKTDSFHNFELATNALDKLGINSWYFHQVETFFPGSDSMATLFYRAYLNIESTQKEAYSLLSMNTKVFETTVNKYKDTIVPDYVSAVLIDADGSKILDEFVFQQKNPDNRVKVFCPDDSGLSSKDITKQTAPKLVKATRATSPAKAAKKICTDSNK